MDDPLVSVLVPTHNRAEMLQQALASVLGQTYGKLEILVADNASEDATPDVLADAARRDSRVRSVRHESNIGFVGNMTYLLKQATGEFVKYLMDDDLLTVDCVQSLVSPCTADPTIGFATSKRAPMSLDLQPLPDVPATRSLSTSEAVVEGIGLGEMALRSNLNVIGEPSTCLFRRDLLEVDETGLRLGGYEFDKLIDLSMWLKVLARTRAYYTPIPKSAFRLHGGQATQDDTAAVVGVVEWERLISLSRQLGYLADPGLELEALGNFLCNAARVRQATCSDIHLCMIDEAVARAGSRLAELAPVELEEGQLTSAGRTTRSRGGDGSSCSTPLLAVPT